MVGADEKAPTTAGGGQWLAMASCLAAILGTLSVGVFLLDWKGRVKFANPRAKELAQQRDGLIIRNEKLEFPGQGGPDLQRELAAFPLKSADGPFIYSISRTSSRRPLTLAMVRLPSMQFSFASPPYVGLFVADPHRSIRGAAYVLANLYGLTPAERRVVQRLLGGQTMKETAQALHVRYSTARSQLLSILRKTGVRRQSELIALCMASSINLRTDALGTSRHQ